MKWLLLIVVAIAALVVAVVVGALLPKDHTVTRAIGLKQPPAVWQAITDYITPTVDGNYLKALAAKFGESATLGD